MERLKENKGITMVALIITIVILLILAGISIGVLTGENGLIQNANQAKEQSEMENEKEMLDVSVIKAMQKDRYGNLEKTNLQQAIDTTIGENQAKVYEDGNDFLILFESKRIYTINQDGNIIDMQKDFENPAKKFASQLEEENYGTEENPYEINCIEDLVDLSYTVNGIEVVDGELSNTSNYNTLKNKHIILNKNLSFTLELSYENSKRIDYGDINGNGKVEELLTELTTEKGWIPIGKYGAEYGKEYGFCGNFSGNNKSINNLYMNNTEEIANAGLFANVSSNKIKDLGVLGKIECNSEKAGGIIADQSNSASDELNIDNCYFVGKIENINTSGSTGGIIGHIVNGNINNCYSRGSITGDMISSESNAGGIVGKTSNGSLTLNNCYNLSNVNAQSYAGGIIGYQYVGARTVINCYNEGEIYGNYTGGILGGTTAGEAYIYNCYNVGDISGSNVGGIMGRKYHNTKTEIKNCYNFSKITGDTNQGEIIGFNWAYDNESSPTIKMYSIQMKI